MSERYVDKLRFKSEKKSLIFIIIFKLWISGMCYFIAFNSFSASAGNLDRLVGMYLILVLVYEYILHNLLLWMSTSYVDTSKYILFKTKKASVLSLLLTFGYILMALGLSLLFAWCYQLLYQAIGLQTFGMLLLSTGAFAMDPFTFSILFVIAEFILYGFKKMIVGVKKTYENKNI